MLRYAISGGLRGVKVLDETLGDVTDIPDLVEKINAFLDSVKADGTLNDMKRRWIEEADETMPEIPLPEDPEVTLTVGTTGFVQPFSYYKDNKIWGFDIEMATRLAAYLGVGVEFKLYDFDGVIAAAQTGVVDCVTTNLNVTPEHQEVIDFSDPIYTSETAILVRSGADKTAQAITELSQLDGKRLGVATGSSFDEIIDSTFRDTEKLYYNNYSDMVEALKQNKLDGFFGGRAGGPRAVYGGGRRHLPARQAPGGQLRHRHAQDGQGPAAPAGAERVPCPHPRRRDSQGNRGRLVRHGRKGADLRGPGGPACRQRHRRIRRRAGHGAAVLYEEQPPDGL